MKLLRHLIEYSLIKIMEAIVSAPPLRAATRWGESLGSTLRRVLPRRSALVLENLRAAFPWKRPEEIRVIADRFWRNLGRIAVEFIRAREVVPDPLGDAHDVSNLDVLKAALAENRGVIIVASHYCNWEINGIILDRLVKGLGGRFTAISRPMKNPFAEAWVQSRRAAEGMPVILHRQAVRESLRTLRRGEAIGALVDQNLYTGGIFVDFFGRPAATTFLPALLHSRTGSPIVLSWVTREDGRFHIHFERVAFPIVLDDERYSAWTRVINERLESIIREKPEWWFWIHNRWKRTGEAAE